MRVLKILVSLCIQFTINQKNIMSNLLSTNNAKTIKGEKKGYRTYIMYLSPYKNNSKGKNLCPNASKGCSEACLFFSGMGGMFTKIQQGRINRTELFLSNRKAFMFKLYSELLEISGKKDNMIPVVRLNGTSDIPFENIQVFDDKTIFELFPNIQFYDYTKNHKRFKKELPKNYHLTFSRDETNDKVAEKLLKKGFNVAYVFNKLPKTYKGFKVINGDENDLRFNDGKKVIIGLKYKKATNKGASIINKNAMSSGFVIIND